MIITYYWPPAGGPGVQRWLKFVKYLGEFGVEPVVYTPKNPHYPIVDKSFEKEIPGKVTVIKRSIFEPYAMASFFSGKKTKQISSGLINEKQQSPLEKMMLWIRGNLFIPDARKFWIKPSVRYLSGYLRRENITTVITTGPPHSLHLIGMELKKRIGVRWIADFRDPWTSISYHEKLKLSRSSQEKHRKLERQVLNEADRIIATSFTTADEFRTITSQPVEVITNGYDLAYTEKVEQDKTFTIAHIGSLLTERNPEMLWEALAELVREHKDFADNLVLKFAGVVSSEVKQSIADHGLGKYLRILGYITHEEALKLQRASQLLLLIEMDKPETRGIIPGKLFEYMAAKRPVIAIGPEGWDVSRIIAETACGTTFTYAEKEALKNKLFKSYERFLWNKLKVSPTGMQKYSRKSLAGKLAAIVLEESE